MTERIEKLLYKELTHVVIGAFYAVYNALGYGFLESVYAAALTLELRRRGLQVKREVPVTVYYLSEPVAHYRVDMLVEGKLMVEIKSCAQVGEIERRQVYNYLRSTNIKLALLLHFGPKPFHYRYISTNKQFNSQS